MLLAFLLPLLLLVFFGYVITLDVDDIALAVLDDDNSPASRELVQSLEAAGYFHVVERLERYGDVERILAAGNARAALVIQPDFGEALAAGRRPGVQLLVDASDANTATIALGFADAILSRYGGGPAREIRPPLEVRSRVWYNPALESRNMIVPGLIAVIMSIIAALLTALTIAREWERGTMEQLASTPVGRFEVVFGKLLPYAVIGLVDVLVTTVAGILLFGVPFRGNPLTLLVLTILFLIGALGFGIFISAALRSQVLATQAAMIASFLPALLLSGFLFDIGSMPAGVRAVTYIVPARYFIVVTRGILLKDVDIDVLWPQALFMLAFAIVGLVLATRAFRKEVA
jgi:ABC-2 type transport system permease protein